MALTTVNQIELDAAFSEIFCCDGRVFVGGNGGSAAISDHLTCDFTKGVAKENKFNPKVISLCGSHALHSAIANDMGYEYTLQYQLELHRLSPNDVVILISSSGNSANILSAMKYAKERCAPVIGMTGFDGGKLNQLADVKLHVDAQNYGVIEDCHQILMHVLAQYMYLHE